MTFEKFSRIFNRAFKKSWGWKRFFFLFSILSLCALLFLFFQGIAYFQDAWLRNTLFFLPIFFGMGIFMAAQVPLSRLYCEESLSFRKALFSSADAMMKISYLTIPLFLLYLLFWVLISLFSLLHTFPFIGSFLSIVLIFAPFLLNLMSILLALSTLFLSFFVAPQIALEEHFDRRLLVRKLSQDPFLNLLFFLIPIGLLGIVLRLLLFAAALTVGVFVPEKSVIEVVLQRFFLALPLVGALTPFALFLINFAVEAHTALLPEDASAHRR